MDDLERLLIERACQRLITAYCHFADHGQSSRITDLFTDDGVWVSGGYILSGRAEMDAAFTAAEANRGRASRHVCGSSLIEAVDGVAASAVTYLTMFEHDGEPGRALSPAEAPTMLGEYRDSFSRTAEGWRFQRRELHINFARPPAANP